MTIQQLSAQAVKIRLTAEELHRFLRQPGLKHDLQSDTPHLTELIACLLAQAEAVCQIPFSGNAVQVELMQEGSGGLTVYFSVKPRQQSGQTVRLAARFADQRALADCCVQLSREQDVILSSSLWRYRGEPVLLLRLIRTGAALPHHLLLEYGRPFRLSAMNRARLTENGTCIYADSAVEHVLSDRG